MVRIEKEINQQTFRNEYHKLIVNIMFTSNWLSEQMAIQLKPFDITLKQYNVLRILRGQHPGPITVKKIRERMLDKMSDASRIVERLRKKGLVTRVVCKDNRRSVDVFISDKGLKLLNELDETANNWENNIKSLTEQEAKRVNELLDYLRR